MKEAIDNSVQTGPSHFSTILNHQKLDGTVLIVNSLAQYSAHDIRLAPIALIIVHEKTV